MWFSKSSSKRDVSGIQLLSHFWLFGTSWTAAHVTSLSFAISQSLLKFMSFESVMPSKHLILCHSLLLLPTDFSSIRILSNESALCNKWPKYWSFSFCISPSYEYSGLVSFGIDWFDLLLSKELSRLLSSTTIQKHWFFIYNNCL